MLALLSSCSSDNIVESGADAPIAATANLNVLVQDRNTGAPLPGGTVKLLSTGESKTTDASGTVRFSNIATGEHSLLVGVSGYASMLQSAPVSSDIDENIFVANEATVSVPLYPLTSSLSGYLFYADGKNGANLPAVGAQVRIQIFDIYGFADRIFTETVGATGKYEFKALPAVGSNYRIWALEYTKDGITYGTREFAARANLVMGAPAYATAEEVYGAATNNSVFAFLGYNSVVGLADTVVFEFSDSIDLRKVTSSTIALNNGQVADRIWKGNKLFLAPVGKWSNNFNVTFGTLTSERGKELNIGSRAVTVLAGDLNKVKVSGLVQVDSANYNSTSVRLRWNKVDSATNYRVFARASAGIRKESFVQVANNLSDTAASVSLSSYQSSFWGLSSPAMFANGDSVQFVVQAYNFSSETSLNDAMVLTVFDRIPPSGSILGGIDPDGVAYTNIMNSTSSANIELNLTNDLVTTAGTYDRAITFRFDEPIDTSAVTVGTLAIQGKMSTSHKWRDVDAGSGDSRLLTVNFSITGTTPITITLDQSLEIRGVKDKRGNLLAYSYGVGSTAQRREVIILRVVATVP